MSLIRTLSEISKHASTSEGFEEYAAAELRNNPRNLVLLETAAHHFWRTGNYSACLECSVRALEVRADSREMLLLAAASAFRLEDNESAFRFANMALQSSVPIFAKDQLSNSVAFRLLMRFPKMRGRLTAMRQDWEERTNHIEELFLWAQEISRLNDASSAAKDT